MPGGRLTTERRTFDHLAKRRLLERLNSVTARKERAHGGTRGSPVRANEAGRRARALMRRAGRPAESSGPGAGERECLAQPGGRSGRGTRGGRTDPPVGSSKGRRLLYSFCSFRILLFLGDPWRLGDNERSCRRFQELPETKTVQIPAGSERRKCRFPTAFCPVLPARATPVENCAQGSRACLRRSGAPPGRFPQPGRGRHRLRRVSPRSSSV